ncbi:MAG: hypothetical protein IH600_03090 [Bacteroidetes bacterium]|nr:hypothetical protein [Bacteroidota bacterium]
MAHRTRTVLLSLAATILLTACVSPTDPDTPRRRITEPSLYFLRTLDMSEYDEGFDIQQVEDGGYIVVGRTWMQHTGSIDVLLLRTDAEGQTLWVKTFGGVYEDEGYSVTQTSDGGFILTGSTESYTNGFNDVWLIKTDANGSMIWSRSFGGNSYDSGQDVIECSNGDFLVAGYTQFAATGNWFAWLVRTDGLGNEIWSKRYGGSERDLGTSVQETEDGGFVVTGSTETGGNGNSELWLFKVAANGDFEWDRRIDGDMSKSGFQLVRAGNGAYGIVGYANPQQLQTSNLLFVKTDASGDMLREVIVHNNAIGTGIANTPDGGFILTGYTDPYGSEGCDIILAKVDMDGNEEWKRVIGGTRMDRALSVATVREGGYILTGTTRSYGSGNQDLLIIKTDLNGVFEE